jgi:TPR repeat protein
MSHRRWMYLPTMLCWVSWLIGCSTTPGDAASRSNHPEQAAALYKIGADRDRDGVAALKLGFLVEDGSISREKWGSAGDWFVRSCELHEVVGCHNAGVHYEAGTLGLSQNYQNAQDFYRKAAIRGYMQSQYNLGSLYANQFLSGDVEGLKWLLVAQSNANTCAKYPLCKWILDDPPGHKAKLKTRMSAEQIDRATREASEVNIPMYDPPPK